MLTCKQKNICRAKIYTSVDFSIHVQEECWVVDITDGRFINTKYMITNTNLLKRSSYKEELLSKSKPFLGISEQFRYIFLVDSKNYEDGPIYFLLKSNFICNLYIYIQQIGVMALGMALISALP
jgi:hypothetical protein